MLEKYIKKNIRRKIDKWLKSIKDEKVKDVIKNNLIVSGGCFVSMLQNETPNDYDCYFRTSDSLKIVLEYYLNQFKNKEVTDIITNKSNIVFYKNGITVKENNKHEYGDGWYIYIKGSGVLRQKKPKDSKQKYYPIYASSNAITLTDGIQIVARFVGSPELLHTNFDFIHTKSYYDYCFNKLVIPKSVYEAVMNKTLIFTNSKYPLCSLFRIKKMMKRGWKISAGEIFKIAFKLNEYDLKDINVLYDQLIGVDSVYFSSIIASLTSNNETYCYQNIFNLVEETFASIKE